MIALMKERAVPAHLVLDQEQADKMTAEDVAGREWKVGDEYYLLTRNIPDAAAP